jgi:hypothetical protein
MNYQSYHEHQLERDRHLRKSECVFCGLPIQKTPLLDVFPTGWYHLDDEHFEKTLEAGCNGFAKPNLRLMFAVKPQSKWSRIKGMAIRTCSWFRRNIW